MLDEFFSSLGNSEDKDKMTDLAEKAQKLMIKNETLETRLSMQESNKNEQ